MAIYAVSLGLCGPPHKSRLHARLNDSCVVILVEPQNCFAHSSTKLCDLRDLRLCAFDASARNQFHVVVTAYQVPGLCKYVYATGLA